VDVIAANPVTLTHQAQIVELAAKNRLPAMYPWPEFIEIGGLMAYSTNRTEMYRRSAAFVDTIHKGAKPADLPIEQPTKFELVVNLKTARTLALTIPSSPAAGGSGPRHPERLCNKFDCANDRHAHAGRAVRTRRRLVAPEPRCVRGAGDRQAVNAYRAGFTGVMVSASARPFFSAYKTSRLVPGL
jgi:ABC transporter substrate binding protein